VLPADQLGDRLVAVGAEGDPRRRSSDATRARGVHGCANSVAIAGSAGCERRAASILPGTTTAT
jgi:hypothetical protein